MRKKLEEKIQKYYDTLHLDKEICFQKEILVYIYPLNGRSFLEIYTNINTRKVITYRDGIKEYETEFSDEQSYYFYFLQYLSKEYFLENEFFYTKQKISVSRTMENLRKKMHKKSYRIIESLQEI